MDFSDFFRNAVPLATVAGVAFAIVNQAFRWTWRLAQVEQKSNENADEISRVEEESVARSEKMEELMACLPRIEVTVNQLIEDRRNGNDRRGAAL